MKRELKDKLSIFGCRLRVVIARPIPMKRELKVLINSSPLRAICYRKAHPDEKGTESSTIEARQDALDGLSQGPSR